MLKLNLPEYQFEIKKIEGKVYVYDIVRKKYIFLDPEEWVRQNFIQYLIKEKGVSKNLMRLEYQISYKNLLKKRADIAVFNTSGKLILLVECKSASTPISQNVIFQLSTYNVDIKVPYLAVTNGLLHYFWKFDEAKNTYSQIRTLPDF